MSYGVLDSILGDKVVLRHSGLDDSKAKEIGEALKSNSTLTYLDMSYNFIGDSGAMALSSALKINSTLTELNLGYNPIGDEGTLSLQMIVFSCQVELFTF